MTRILVTGSRDWQDRDTIDSELWRAWTHLGCGSDMVLVHGDCPTGADAIAAELWRSATNGPIESHPADWSQGRKAGPDRNAAMVALGADICLAFIGPCTSPRCNKPGPHPSHGATGCAALAEAAGIPTRRFYADEVQP